MIMVRPITSLDKEEKAAKLPAGPTSSKPGPTLLMQVRAEVKETVKETSSKEMIKAAVRRIKM